MITHDDLIQGSPEWLAHRAQHFNASEAAAMLGLSKTTTRTELLRIQHTGIGKEFSDWVQRNVLDHGHEVEAKVRPLIEAMIGEDLYPVTCSDARLSASLDGLTMGEELAFECKQWNTEISAQVAAGVMPEQHMPQCQQILMISKASKLIFAVGDGTPDNLLTLDVFPDPVWFARIRAGWAQFEVDLAAYAPAAQVIEAVGHTPESLPALRIEVTGMVTASNLEAYKEHALAVFGSINRELKTDQQFADAEKVVKWCGDIEDRLAAAKQHALSQTESIDALFRTIDDISAEARRTRLELDKLVKIRKEAVRGEIVAEGAKKFNEHIKGLNDRLAGDFNRNFMPTVPADFVGAIKGKRTIDSLRDAVNTTLANAKIEASAIADKIQVNLTYLAEDVPQGYAFLFADLSGIVIKDTDDFRAIVDNRISAHKAKREKEEAETRESARIEALAEIIRKMIRKEEQAKLAAAAVIPHYVTAPAMPEAVVKMMPATVLQAMTEPAPMTPPTLKLGQIGERLGFSLTGDFLKSLGFEPAARDKSALLFHEASFTLICAALVNHINGVQAKVAA